MSSGDSDFSLSLSVLLGNLDMGTRELLSTVIQTEVVGTVDSGGAGGFT